MEIKETIHVKYLQDQTFYYFTNIFTFTAKEIVKNIFLYLIIKIWDL